MKPWLTASLLTLATPAVAQELRIIAVDVDGGAANLFITPGGKSLLIDTGFPAGLGGPRPGPGEPAPPPRPSSAARIVAAAHAAGLTRIDQVVISHYHTDHVGGVFDLLPLIPIGGFIDHGPNREPLPAGTTPAQAANAPATLYPRYLAAIAGRPHRVMKAGDRIVLDGLELTAVNSDGEVAPPPRGAGAGGPGVDCADTTSSDRIGGEENPRSLGLVLRWGRARILSGGDTTINVENRLVCPIDRVGPIDLMFADHHGSETSNSPNFVATLRPRVVIVSNGPTKGGDAVVLDRLRALPGLEGLWQLHFATRSPASNTPPERIANIDPSTDHGLTMTVGRDGAISVRNDREGAAAVRYPPRR